jgi:hypothetical protein
MGLKHKRKMIIYWALIILLVPVLAYVASVAINDQTKTTDVAADDVFPLYDTSATAGRGITGQNLADQLAALFNTDHGDVSYSAGTATVDSGAVLLNEIGDPGAAVAFDFGAGEELKLTFNDESSTTHWKLESDALKTDTDVVFFEIEADADGTPVDVFKITGGSTRPVATGDLQLNVTDSNYADPDNIQFNAVDMPEVDMGWETGQTFTTVTASSYIQGLVMTTLDTDATVDLSNSAGADGEWRVNNDDDVIQYTLPPAVLGLTVCFYDHSANGQVISIDPDDGTDAIYLNGASVGAGDEIDSPGDRGDFICLLALDGDTWVTIGQSGTWVDGGAS